MTYKELIETIGSVCINNYFVNSFSSGKLTEINMGEDSPSVLYPHAFLIPTNLTSTKQTTTFSFTLVMMTKTNENYEDELRGQSDMIENLYDFLSIWNNYNFQWNIGTSYTITPFKESYKDVLVGASLSMSIQIPRPLNKCETPTI